MHWSVYVVLGVAFLIGLLIIAGAVTSATYKRWASETIPGDLRWRESVALFRHLRQYHPEADLSPFRAALEQLEKQGVLESRIRRPDGHPIMDTFGEWRRKPKLQEVQNVA